jgi:hypothetical protein
VKCLASLTIKLTNVHNYLMTSKLYYHLADVLQYIQETERLHTICNNINHPEYAKYFQLKELYNFYSFCTPCKIAVDEFEGIFKEVNDLNNAAIKEWVNKNLPFFTEFIYGLGILYTDINHELKSDFYFSSYELFVEREPFIPVIKYRDLMWSLTN